MHALPVQALPLAAGDRRRMAAHPAVADAVTDGALSEAAKQL
jgi:hypothetical protein